MAMAPSLTAPQIVPARIEHLEGIREIYNEAVLNTTATFDTDPRTPAEQEAWFKNHGPLHPVRVALENGKVVGWAAMNRWSDRKAYDVTAEISVYIEKRARGRGLGRALIAEIMKAAKEAGLHSILARITTDNPASVHLHLEAGFVSVGILRECGRKFGRLLDVEIMQKLI